MESRIYARYILKTKPDARIAVLYQNDDFGKDYLVALKSRLGLKANSMIVAEASYELADPSIDSQMIQLKASGVEVLLAGEVGRRAERAGLGKHAQILDQFAARLHRLGRLEAVVERD
jgi:branched-chain amino acid transport system substrate-binding protein